MTTKPDELDVWILRLAKYANTLTPYKLDDPIDPIVQDGLNEAKQAIQAHIDKKVNEVLDRVEAEAGWYSQQFNDQARKDNIEDTLIRLSSIKKLRSEL
jgi:hypothetical protein